MKWKEIEDRLQELTPVVDFYLKYSTDERIDESDRLKYRLIADELINYVSDSMPYEIKQKIRIAEDAYGLLISETTLRE